MIIPNDAPHCVHSLPNTIGLSILIKETLSPDSFPSKTQVSHHPVVRHDPISPPPVSPDHFGVSLHKNLVEIRDEQPALLVSYSITACRGIHKYFELKRGSNALAVFDIQGRLQPLQGDLVASFLEFTQFVPGTLDRLYTGACVVYSIGGSDGP